MSAPLWNRLQSLRGHRPEGEKYLADLLSLSLVLFRSVQMKFSVERVPQLRGTVVSVYDVNGLKLIRGCNSC